MTRYKRQGDQICAEVYLKRWVIQK
jgi:hypothetical protein